jgi:hypothetical protein
MFTPCVVRGHQAIRFKGRIGLEGVFEGMAVVTGGTSPTGPAVECIAFDEWLPRAV